MSDKIEVGDKVAVACKRSIGQKYRGDIAIVKVVQTERLPNSSVWHLSDRTRARSSAKILKVNKNDKKVER